MADTKISALTAGTAAPGDEIPVNRGGVNYKITAGDILKQDSGTLTANAPALDLTQTWNAGGVTFTGLKFNATDTASASGSLLMDLQVGGETVFLVSKNGFFSNSRGTPGNIVFNEMYGTDTGLYNGTPALYFNGGGSGGVQLIRGRTARISWGTSRTAKDTSLYSDTADCLDQRNGANAQTFRIYNTYTDATNTFERGTIKWDSNVLKIGTEKGLVGGTARALELQTDGTTRLTISSAGVITSNSGTFYVNAGPAGIASGSGSTLSLRYAGVEYINVGSNLIKYRDAANFEFGTTTGTKIGTGTTQKLGFFDATPVVQQNGTGETTGFTAGTGTAVNDDSTFTGNVGATAYRINDIVKALKNLGLLAQ